jgi:uncharacterized protein YecT (DUF1311 family)
MPNDDLTPAMAKLDGDYQVLTELHGEGDSRTYLARHLRLNRDVTVSVFRADDGERGEALTQFASDARLLTEARHPHIVPVIDGIWLDDRTFATVRARVRGATLDQLLSASGPMSTTRVATTIREIAEALSWARDTGVAQRDIAPWDVVFQQGNGRVLLAFEPAKSVASAVRNECDDAQTVRRLTIEMFAGEIDRSLSAQEIAVPRSIPPGVADALAAMRHCTARNATSSMDALLTALDGATPVAASVEKSLIPVKIATDRPVAIIGPAKILPERIVPTVVQRSADVPTGPVSVISTVPPRRKGIPAHHHDDAVILSKPSYSFNARFGTAVAVVLAVGVGGFLWLSRTHGAVTTVAAVAPVDTGTTAAGEVALHPQPAAVSPVIATPPAPRRDSIMVPRRTLTPPPRVTSSSSDSLSSDARTAVRSDSTIMPPKKAVVLDSVAEAERQFKRDSAADVEDPCLSSEASSQRLCLTESIQRNDRELNRVYSSVIASLRRQSGVGTGDPDPDAVTELRATQRKWLDDRDATCREIGEEPLYAKSRAACYAQKATDRARDLQRKLDSIPPTG